MASILKQVNKIFMDNWVVILALLVGIIGIGRYSMVKFNTADSMAVEGAGPEDEELMGSPPMEGVEDMGSPPSMEGVNDMGSPPPMEGMSSPPMGSLPEGMDTQELGSQSVLPAGPLGTNSDYAQVQGIQTGRGLPSVDQRTVNNPSDLLPSDENSEWAKLNPTGQGDLNSYSSLPAGHHVGVNTVGQSLRNANYQLRSDPPIPRSQSTGPWNQTTIEGDNLRVPLELGVAPARN